MRFLRSRESIADVSTEFTSGGRQLGLVVDRERASALGFNTEEVANTVSSAIRGANLREFVNQDGEVPVRMKFIGSEQFTPDQIEVLNLENSEGLSVPLSALADVTYRSGPAQISRRDRETSARLELRIGARCRYWASARSGDCSDGPGGVATRL